MKAAFGQSLKSFICEALGDRRTTYSKPGWVPKDEHRPNTYDDAAIVIDGEGRRYLLSIMSTIYPYGDYSPLCDLACALDAVHEELQE